MTDKIQHARRAAFEQWAERHRMQIGRDGVVVDYSSRATDACWMAFNAALDCVVIELPPELHAYTGQPQDERLLDADRNHTIKQCRAAIESTNLGIKVK